MKLRVGRHSGLLKKKKKKRTQNQSGDVGWDVKEEWKGRESMVVLINPLYLYIKFWNSKNILKIEIFSITLESNFWLVLKIFCWEYL